MLKIDSRWYWIFLGVSAILFRIILDNAPETVEQYYSRGIFPAIRYIFDYTIGLIPFATLYILIFGVLCFVLLKIFRKNKKRRSLKKRIISFVFSLFAFVSAVVFLFLFLWGFNYNRIPVEQQIKLEVRPLSKSELLEEFMLSTEALEQAYLPIQNMAEEDFLYRIQSPEFEAALREKVSQTFKALGYPTPGCLRARMLYPKGSLLRISTAGFYLPFTGECHLDPGLHPLQIPYVMAHELSHGYGIGDEGSCNFFAYLTCMTDDDPFIKYAGALSYWRSVAGQYRSFDPEHYKQLRAQISPGILAHVKAISQQMNKYPDIFPRIRDATYNAYLKTQGIEEGLKNYSRVLLLVHAYRKTKAD